MCQRIDFSFDRELMDNKVFFQHPDLMRALCVHETVMQLMVNTLNKAQQQQQSANSAMAELISSQQGRRGSFIPSGTLDSLVEHTKVPPTTRHPTPAPKYLPVTKSYFVAFKKTGGILDSIVMSRYLMLFLSVRSKSSLDLFSLTLSLFTVFYAIVLHSLHDGLLISH